MYSKKSLSLLVIFIFTFAICLGIIGNRVNAQIRTGDQVTATEGAKNTEGSLTDEELIRNESFYNYGETTTAVGAIQNWWEYGPDAGIGETGSGYTQTNPFTGATVTFSTTGMGAGAGGVLAGYGGMYSPVATQSYGMFAGGATPQYNVNQKLGYNTQLNTSGSLFGPASTYTSSAVDPLMQLGMTLGQQSQTQGLGMALTSLAALQYASPGGYGTASAFGSPYTSGYGIASAFGSPYTSGYGTASAFGSPYTSAYGSPYTSAYGTASAYGSPYTGYSSPSVGYGTASAYGSPYTGYSTPYAGYGTASAYGSPYTGYATPSAYGTGYSSYGTPSTSGYYTGGTSYYPQTSGYGYY